MATAPLSGCSDPARTWNQTHGNTAALSGRRRRVKLRMGKSARRIDAGNFNLMERCGWPDRSPHLRPGGIRFRVDRATSACGRWRLADRNSRPRGPVVKVRRPAAGGRA